MYVCVCAMKNAIVNVALTDSCTLFLDRIMPGYGLAKKPSGYSLTSSSPLLLPVFIHFEYNIEKILFGKRWREKFDARSTVIITSNVISSMRAHAIDFPRRENQWILSVRLKPIVCRLLVQPQWRTYGETGKVVKKTENRDESYDIGRRRFGILKKRGVYFTCGKGGKGVRHLAAIKVNSSKIYFLRCVKL